MAQISITIPNDVDEILSLMSAEQKRSKSELASHALEIGLAQYLESLNKRATYKMLAEERKARKQQDQTIKAKEPATSKTE